MSVKLRMKRMGRKKIPYYRLIAIDSRRQRDGKELDRVGIYNPLPENEVFNVDEEKLFYWLEQGAEPSDTVRTLMQNYGLALKWHLKSQGKSDEEIESEYQKWQLLRESKAAAKAEQEKRDTEKSAKAKPEPEPEPEPEEEQKADAESAAEEDSESTASTDEVKEEAAADATEEEDSDPEVEAEEASADTDAEVAEEDADAETGDAAEKAEDAGDVDDTGEEEDKE